MKNEKFREMYMNLPRANKEHLKIRKEIEKQCKVSSSVVYNWNLGLTKIPHWAESIIAKIFNMKISELFPEKEITETIENQ